MPANSSFYGLVTDLAPSATVLAFAQDLGAKAVRSWHSTDFSNAQATTANSNWGYEAEELRKWKAAGFSTTLVLNLPENSSTSANVDNIGNYLTLSLGLTFSGPNGPYSLASVVDRWEIGNEVDQSLYYPWASLGTAGAKHYVDHMLKPAWDVLHPLGYTVIGAAPTSTVLPSSATPGATPHPWLQQLFDAGYASYCDVANMHPYKPSAGDAINTSVGYINLVNQYKPGMPVTATEMNGGWFRNDGIGKDFAALMTEYQNWAKDHLESLFLYILEAQDRFNNVTKVRTPDGNPDYYGYLISNLGQSSSSTFVKNQPFYDTYKGWTATAPNLPGAPALTVGTVTSTSVALSWTPAWAATGYVVERSTTLAYNSWANVATVSASTYAVTDGGRAANTVYYYRVRATNGAGSTASRWVSATTAAGIPAAPTSLAVVATTSASASLNWGAVAGAASYDVQRSAASNGTFANVVTSYASTSYTDPGLAASTSYYYRVIAKNSAGSGPASAVVQATTAAASGGSPTTTLAAQDAYVADNAFSVNYGSSVDLYVQNSSDVTPDVRPNRRTYVDFDIAGIDAATLTSSLLRVRAYLTQSAGSGLVLNAHQVNAAWNESTVTWNAQPSFNAAVASSTTVASTSALWHDIELVDLVRSARQAGQTTLRLVLRTPAANVAAIHIDSRESSNAPRLVSTYAAPTKAVVQDAFVQDNNFNVNYGSATDLYVANSSDVTPDVRPNRRTYMNVDIAGIDPAALSTANLCVYANLTQAVSGGLTLNVHEVTADWGEGTITWNAQPAFNASVSGFAVVSGTAPVWTSVPITELVRAARQAGRNTLRVVLRTPVANPASIHLTSRESASAPYLTTT